MALDPPEKTVFLGLAYFLGGMILAPSLGPIVSAIAIIGGLAYAASGVIDATIDLCAKLAARAEPRIGEKMPDGTVLAGVSPDTGKPMYVTPADASLTMKFNQAKEYAAKLDAHGHQDWRVPTKAELNVLFNNRAAIGGFDISGSTPDGWYWSTSSNGQWDAWGQRFSDGHQYDLNKGLRPAVRCVR